MATEYTDEQILNQARAALYSILGGAQSYSFNGRVVTKADLAAIRETIAEYEAKVAAEDGGAGIGGGTLLVKFGDVI